MNDDVQTDVDQPEGDVLLLSDLFNILHNLVTLLKKEKMSFWEKHSNIF